ncbi:aminoacyl-tRNA hydrolase [Microcella daejeonensis]|uniref:Peptidyl-tRNA hydrolase n=1 Tax=Microcella daejeonensis TaxID=2994971 RepID=A0A9E8MJ63_9MICO|nr:aminoacyl-tRNA hydrolase [Microcella daejeonensis]WAB80545.1 aminoacyl-tRNA hydrolase [Microcella daejeonensis]WAB85146.1 aminoacyl-tRNA hydrolase [Microcella daejeonensis]
MADENVWLVAGLGNPGPGYAGNRHNVGQMALDELADQIGARFSRHRTTTMLAEGRLRPGGPKLVLIKPMSYMNTSGGPVSSAAKYFGIPPERTIVLHDDLDLPFETIRLKADGGHGGQNGVRDIIKALGTPQFLRVRIGIGRPPGRQDPAEYVLKDFAGAERARLSIVLGDAADAVQDVIDDGLTSAQQRWHAPRP